MTMLLRYHSRDYVMMMPMSLDAYRARRCHAMMSSLAYYAAAAYRCRCAIDVTAGSDVIDDDGDMMPPMIRYYSWRYVIDG